ncbi:Anhydro-N-acetylmuramic acid kinase [Vibrio thalassae]|uniref:Anhydro-N-acetylmuramic acid kinase n=2 Tax=Vibrio thalassae TaxID=1243014 RepID=A0A240EFA3_9VIBR|nr:Anhydro-N-acetylmuramic acid kinase [Vibrio thalassae]
MMSKEALYIGIMSGTSLDGVDTALVSIKGREITLLASDFLNYPESLKKGVLAICHGEETTLKHIGELDHQLGLLYAEAVNALLSKTSYSAHDITAIGNHGQTVFHQPEGAIRFTTQLGDNNLVATLTGINTVGDFRRKDMALGGQGAPLVPAFHRYLFADSDSTQVILNIGGISNVSILQPNGDVIGFDTGPGNVLLDHWCSHAFSQSFDKDAQLAKQGHVIPCLLEEMLNDDYLARPAPKSTGRERYHEQWLSQCLAAISTPMTDHDVLRTLTEFTALTIANAIQNCSIGTTPKLLVCGGGANNPIIMKRLSELLIGWSVAPTDSEAISGDYMESMAFAWLAHCYLNKIPSNLPSVTGASKAVPLGVLYSAD